ncbi:MAG: iron-containing alcohol dehydrogenase [Clostridia bacterium]|nr:iron-containing alcohol dehydrogenase [Clostridia bacterium]MBO5671122.1 iron-containing alcohol dehydrogenase [Clostridia bacterium]
MNFSMFMPVDIRTGIGCVEANAECFAIGRHAFLVTGRHAAKACGAQEDVIRVLRALGIAYTVYDQIGENPLMSVCWEGGQMAAGVGADMVIGIGGGSAMDAAKAIAAYAANPSMEPRALMTENRPAAALPIILIPTTAGTGSEANPYAILTLDGDDKKWTFKDPNQTYAKYAFLDARYTASLSEKYTVSCALDAFAHCAESYLSPKANDVSRMFAAYGARALYAFIRDFEAGGDISSLETRERLLYASCAGGIAINMTGTGFPHPLGYNLTLMRGVPHGAACGAFYRHYLDFCERGDAALCRALYDAIGAAGEEIKTVIPMRSNVRLVLDDGEIARYVEKVRGASNYKNCPYVITPEEMVQIYTELFGE